MVLAQIIECPLHQRKLLVNSCAECKFHHGIKALVLVERIGSSGQREEGEQREMLVADVADMRSQLGSRAQVSVRATWVDCHYPRAIRMDDIYGGLTDNALHV